jgi:glutaredoxin
MWPWKKHVEKVAVVYTRQGCHLCEDARAMLQAEGFRVREVDVDGDPALRERHGECVPVVEIDGKVRFRGRVNRVLLRRLLRN